MPIGTVIWFSFSKGYGFIRPDDGSKDTLVRVSAIGRSDFDDLRKGQKLSFDHLQDKQSGTVSAENLRLLS
jgi:CspA family cold shock protein